MFYVRLLGIVGAFLMIASLVSPGMLLSPIAAFAAGSSAADSQYQDPLAGSTATESSGSVAVPHTTSVTTASGTSSSSNSATTSTSTSPARAVVTSTASSTTPAESSKTKTASTTDTVVRAPSTLSSTAPPSIDGNSEPSGSLPMTGLNAEVIAVVGLLLLAGGLVLRWRTARYSR